MLVEYLKLHVATPNKWIIFALSSLFPVCNWIKCKYLWSRFHDNHLQVRRLFFQPKIFKSTLCLQTTSCQYYFDAVDECPNHKTAPFPSFQTHSCDDFFPLLFSWITLLSFSNYAQKMFSFSVLDRFNFSRFTRLEMHIRLENHQCVTKMQPN